MRKRKLGKTGLQVSELGFGAWAIGGTSYGPTDGRESLKALAFAFDQGVNFFDTADTYGHGHSEQLIGETFKESSKRSQVIIASKVGWDFYHGGSKKNFDPDYIRFACGESLKRLRTDYIELYQLHNPKLEMIEEGSVFNVLHELQQAGKIRFWGVSIYVAKEGEAVICEGSSRTIQAIYNMIDQRIQHELMPLCEEHEIGLIAREPLYCGLLTDKYTAESRFTRDDHRNRWMRDKYLTDLKKIERVKDILYGTGSGRDRFLLKESQTNLSRNGTGTVLSLKQAAIEFALSEEAVSTVIPGMKTVAHVQDHLRAVREPKLTPENIGQIQKLYEEDELFQTGFYRN
jgi:aryl-alcohol dehydrogenase-like predicted oxidoreductase